MPIIEHGSITLEVDGEGYLVNTNDWSEKAACALAENEGIDELTKEKLEIIKFLRQYYNQFRSFPILNAVCKNIHQPNDCVNEEFIDPLKAWKIAGLPRPVEEVISYLERTVS